MVDSRTARQQEAVGAWLKAKASGTFTWATGMGKSYTAVKVVKQMQEKHPAAKADIVVPTLYLKEQFQKAVAKAELPNTAVHVVNTYVKSQHQVDLLIIDEVHSMLGEHAHEFPKTFEVCDSKWRLGLSATLLPEEQAKLADLGMPVVDTITIQEALQEGWVAPFRQYNLAIPLLPEERSRYEAAHKVFLQHFSKFGHDFQLAMACIGDPRARRKHAEFMGWKESDGPKHVWSPTSIGAFANIWHRAMKERKYIVDHAAQKYEAALTLIHKFPVPTICFSESTTFASELAARCPDICRAYHSKVPSTTETYYVTKKSKQGVHEVVEKVRRVSGATLGARATRDFADRESEVRVLSTAKALDQGADFPFLRLGIETSGNGSVRQKVQRTGRVVRKDEAAPADAQQAVYVHIYAADSYEQQKLRRKQKGMQVIEVTDISQIIF